MAEKWVITGASRGIGLAVARAHLSRGGHVLASFRQELSPALAGLQEEYPDRLTCLTFDLRDGDSIARAAGRTRGPVDVLFNNAGIYGPRNPSFRGLNSTAAIEAFNINALGVIRVTDAFLPHLAGVPRPRIVAVSSLMGASAKPGAGSLAYRMSKAALNRAMQAIGQELAPQNIAVACLRPGHVRTDMTNAAAPMSPEQSAEALLAVVDALKPEGRTKFLDITGGTLDW